MADYVLGVASFIDRELQRERLRRGLTPDLIQVDDGSLGCMGNHLGTLQTLSQMARAAGADWVVVLEDDAIPISCFVFHTQLNMALDVAPSPVVSLYSGTGYPAQAQRRFVAAHSSDASWVLHRDLRHAVGYALHSDVFELGLLDVMTRRARQNWAPDDAISDWCHQYAKDVAYTNPSLVDHEDGPQVVSGRTHLGRRTGIRRRRRKAHHVGTRALWTDSTVIV